MKWSIVIPTYNRAAIMAKCLTALDRQTFDDPFEVIVVDDGSSDATPQLLKSRTAANYQLRSFRQQNQKPAAARNLAMQHASGDLVLFLGDDIIASSTLLAEHDAAHATHSGDFAILGYTTWSAELQVTRFMEYLGEQGWQFGYS